MKRAVRLTGAAVLISSLLPVQPAHGAGAVVVVFSGEAHLTSHRCNTLDKHVLMTCGAMKNAPTAFTFGASEAKKPKKDGNVTRCFAVKIPISTSKNYAPFAGPLCDIHVTGTTSKKNILTGGDSPLGFCEHWHGPWVGTFAVYESHAGPKKTSNIAGVFEIKGGFGRIFGSEKKQSDKKTPSGTQLQGGNFNGLIRVGAAGLTKGNTDTLDDCYLAAVNGKDDPQQFRFTGFQVEVQTDQ